MLSGKTFMITGSTGRLGCELVARLEELNAVVLPLVLDGYPSFPKRVKWKAKTKPIILKQKRDLDKLHLPDYVINLHWRVDRSLSFSEQLLFEIGQNIHALFFLWEWLAEKAFSRFVNISSIDVFSHLNKNPISVDTDPRPVTPYGIAKLTADKFFEAYFYNSAFSFATIRLCSVASGGEHPSKLISQLVASAFRDKKIRINTGHKTNLIYIDEAVDLMISAAITARERQYILASKGVENEIIASEFERVSGLKLNAEYIDLMPGRADRCFISDIPKLSAGWTRKSPFDEMVHKLIFDGISD
jgi:nucleoside-diphosphate-sugar epimerase